MSLDALQKKIRTYKCPLALGLEPALEDVPPQLLEGEARTPAGIAQALETYSVGVLEAAAELVPAVKLRQASYEAYGAPELCAMSERLANALRPVLPEAAPLGTEQAQALLERAKYGGIGLPWLVNRAVVEGGVGDV